MVSFGWLALGFDAAVHRTVAAITWLSTHPWLVGAAILALAGAFQFSDLKDRCLTQCRHPAAYLLRHYRRGPRAAFAMGWGHGLYCLGCCWALMLVMFAAGVADLRWMAALGSLMPGVAGGFSESLPCGYVQCLACGRGWRRPQTSAR